MPVQRTIWLIVAVVLLIVTIVIGYKLHIGSEWPSLWAVVLGLAVVVTLIVVTSSYAEFLNYFVFALCGGTLGWVIGILASPSTAQEERIFGEYKTAITAFVSGFAVTKLNDIWKLLTDDKENKPPLLLQMPVLSRMLLFAGMFFLLVAQQYNVRQSRVGNVIVSPVVAPKSALAGQTLATVEVRPGATITLKGAAEAPDMDVDWSISPDTGFAKTVSFDSGNTASAPVTADAKTTSPDAIVAKVTVPDAVTLSAAGVKDGDKIQAVATSRWNHAKTASLDIIVRLDKPAEK